MEETFSKEKKVKEVMALNEKVKEVMAQKKALKEKLNFSILSFICGYPQSSRAPAATLLKF